MVELETRELDYFVAVAEELHFGHAAARLSIAQPALSKAIRRIETRLGVQLLVRSSRHVSLTPAGEALLRDGRHTLAALSTAVQNARQAGNADAGVRLVMKPGGDANLLSGILAAYASTPNARTVDIVFAADLDRADYLRDGRADVGLLYVPFDDLTGLSYETLYVEGRVALLSREHPLASRSELHLADLEQEALPRWKGLADRSGAGPSAWRGLPGGGSGPEVENMDQVNQLIALGRAVAILPRSLAEPIRPGLVCIPVTDAVTSQLVLGWSRENRSQVVADFIQVTVGQARATAQGLS